MKGFVCPSRAHTPGDHPEGDTWVSTLNGDRICSFCGSTHPDDAVSTMKEFADTGEGQFDVVDDPHAIYVHRAGVRSADEGGTRFYKWHFPRTSSSEMNELHRQFDRCVQRRCVEREDRLVEDGGAAATISKTARGGRPND